jgi:hypothetical protein
VFKSRRVQELAHGITILADAYLYFGDERYYEYAKGATKCLISHYQREDGRIEIDWGDKKEDYTTVCCPMIPISDMARILSTRDKEFSDFCYRSADKMAEYLYNRGTKFPTEGVISENAEEEMEDGSISCTALALLYYCKNVRKDEKYLQKAKEILADGYTSSSILSVLEYFKFLDLYYDKEEDKFWLEEFYYRQHKSYIEEQPNFGGKGLK